MSQIHTIGAVDSLGRTLSPISGYKKDKYVGLFYFLWHGQHAADRVRNVTELLRTNYDDVFDPSYDNTEVPYECWLHYHEPLYGYYNSDDAWVMRKHIELFIAMGVDFLAMDFTNAIIYWKPLETLMELLLEYAEAGWQIPKITFYINMKANELTRALYERVYLNERYKNLVFYGNYEKPMIISVPHELDPDLNEYFVVRASQWNRLQYPETNFAYWDVDRVMRKYGNMCSVSLAQASAFSYAFEKPDPNGDYLLFGRGYSSRNPVDGNPEAIMRGDNFQECWEMAMAMDPEYIFVTGWNEWVVQKIDIMKRRPQSHVQSFANYTDNFNVEYSRDVEMTKAPGYVLDGEGNWIEEGYGDNYLIQLAENIRRFKGISLTAGATTDSVYKGISTRKTARDCRGFYKDTYYTREAPIHFIQNVTVSHDETTITFEITTQDPIVPGAAGKTNFMNLFIGVAGNEHTGWAGYQYVVNRKPTSSEETSLEHFTDVAYESLTQIGSAAYEISGHMLVLRVPLAQLGITRGSTILFKVADGVEEEGNILDYYVSGDVFPLGRFGYRYTLE